MTPGEIIAERHGCGGTLDAEERRQLAADVDRAIAAEREHCADVAASFEWTDGRFVARAIRDRGAK